MTTHQATLSRSQFDQHVVPEWQDHDTAATCWCGPVLDYVDPVTGGSVWVHRTANDKPHYEPDPTGPDTHTEGEPE